uniref:Uncharacterized protein n=1 Tax=Rhizophora mucronata TaxID=61149 RepID=A0A2P2Q9K3_RHIMU
MNTCQYMGTELLIEDLQRKKF